MSKTRKRPPPKPEASSFAPLSSRASLSPTSLGGGESDDGELDLEHAISGHRRLGRRPTMLGRLVRISFGVGLLSSMMLAAFAYTWLTDLGVFDITDARLDAITQVKPIDNTLVFDRDGNKIGEFFDNYQVFVPFKQIPKSVIDAIVAIEDRNFWVHKGFDPKGIMRAVLVRLEGKPSRQGASTITQQVVRHFLLSRERTIERKVMEIALAIRLEQRMSKEKLIEIYANSLFLGNGSYGIGAAAQRYFGKQATALEPHEAALLAGLFQSPSRFNPSRFPKRAKNRQRQVIRAMAQSQAITAAKAKELMLKPLVYREYKPLNTEFAPYFVDYIREQVKNMLAKAGGIEGQGLRIYTTLDMKLQRLAEESLVDSSKLLDDAEERTQRLRLKSGKIIPATLEAAILTVEPKTGEILAMVGGRNYEKSKFNRTWQSMRSPGSAFKPVVYSLALTKKFKWSDVIFVSPITIDSYRPHTPDEDMLTETTIFRAFYRSMNTPTIELGQKIGLGPVIEQAKRLGIRTPIKEEFGSMLGSSDTTMMDLGRMYAAFANEGKIVEQISITKILDRQGKLVYKAPRPELRSTQAVSEQIAFLMTQGMRAVLGMGTAFTSAKLSGVAAGKTGTSNDATDNWFCGYAPNLATIVWVGTDEHASINGDTTGAKLALPIWDRYMTKALSLRKPPPFKAPRGIVTTVIHPKFGNRSPDGVRMYFLRGNEPAADTSALETLSQSTDGYRDVFAH